MAITGEDPGVQWPLMAITGKDPGVQWPLMAITGEDPGVHRPLMATTGEGPGVQRPLMAITGEDPGVQRPLMAITGEDPGVQWPLTTTTREDPGSPCADARGPSIGSKDPGWTRALFWVGRGLPTHHTQHAPLSFLRVWQPPPPTHTHSKSRRASRPRIRTPNLKAPELPSSHWQKLHHTPTAGVNKWAHAGRASQMEGSKLPAESAKSIRINTLGVFDSRVRRATSPQGLETGRSQPFGLTGRAARANRTRPLPRPKPESNGTLWSRHPDRAASFCTLQCSILHQHQLVQWILGRSLWHIQETRHHPTPENGFQYCTLILHHRQKERFLCAEPCLLSQEVPHTYTHTHTHTIQVPLTSIPDPLE